MLEDEVELELKIMAESGSSMLTPDTFQRPIAALCRRPITTVSEQTTLEKTVGLMQERSIGAVAVTNASGRLAGIFTERDLMRRVIGRGIEMRTEIGTVMTPDPTWLLKTDSIVFLMNKMNVGGYRHLPILAKDGTPLHMVSVRDVLHFFFEVFPAELINVAPEPYRGPPQQYGG